MTQIEVVDFKGDTWKLLPYKYRRDVMWCFCNEVIEGFFAVPLPVFSEWWRSPPTESLGETLKKLHTPSNSQPSGFA